MFNNRCQMFYTYLASEVFIMAGSNGGTNMLNPKRNETADRKKLFEEMLLREIPGNYIRILWLALEHM